MSPWWLQPTEESPAEEVDSPETVAKSAEESPVIESKAAKKKPVKKKTSTKPSAKSKPAELDAAQESGTAPETAEEVARPRTRRPRRRTSKRSPSQEGTDSAPVSKSETTGEALSTIAELLASAAPERSQTVSDELKIALFVDLENIALGVRDSDIKKFDIHLVLERLLEKGRIIFKKAYADWDRYGDYKRPFHEAAIELIEIPQKHYSGKNSADIRMVVDAMDLCYSKEHLDTFVVMSGDSDFSPLVSKLRENNKHVIGVGVKGSTSSLLIDNCDEFLYYEDVWRDRQKAPSTAGLSAKNAEAFQLMIDSIQALQRENKAILWGSMIKQTMQRKKPSFNEGYYGFSTFSDLLEEAQRQKLIKLKRDRRSGSYIVAELGA